MGVLAGLDKFELLAINKAYAESPLDFSSLSDSKSFNKLVLNAVDVDTDSLSMLTGLEQISLSRIDIDNINFVKSLKNLKSVYLYMTDTKDISAISGLKELKELQIEFCKEIKDLSPLGELVNLEKLHLGRNDYLSDFTPLSNLKNLEELSVNVCLTDINNISPIKEFVNLKRLELGNVNMSDISDLEIFYELTGLETLSFRSYLPIEDIKSLKEKLPGAKIYYSLIE